MTNIARNGRRKRSGPVEKTRIGTYPVNYVMPLILDVPGRVGKFHKITFNDIPVNMASDRMRCFLHSGTVCVCCGLEGSFFALERWNPDDEFVLNLYGKAKDGTEVMFTKDHIVPKSKGGPSNLSNYQSMCSVCNLDKGNRIEEPTMNAGAWDNTFPDVNTTFIGSNH